MVNTMGLHYVAQVFALGSWDNSITALGSYYHLGHVLIIAVYIALLLMPEPSVLQRHLKTN